MSKDIEIIKSRSVLEVLTVAHEFCMYTEDIKSKKKDDIISFYQKVLPLLYIKGSLIPEIEVQDRSANEKFVAEEHWENIYMAANEKFGKEDKFWIIDDLNETMKSSIAENIADIYQDMKDFVVLFQKNSNSAKENAVYDCKQLFATHWGVIISRLLPHLHKLNHTKELNQSDSLIF